MTDLRVTEIFYSLQGETATVGWPTVFIRLTGCPLRCQYCDTAYAFSGGELYSMDRVLDTVATYSPRYVTLTGGEPLAQPGAMDLLTKLCDAGYSVSLETSGALDISGVDDRVVKILDIKTPGSLEVHRNDFNNLQYLTAKDQVKFVICDENDYNYAVNTVSDYQLTQRCDVLFSPSYGQQDPQTLADWMIRDRLNVRFQMQLHKSLWGDVEGK